MSCTRLLPCGCGFFFPHQLHRHHANKDNLPGYIALKYSGFGEFVYTYHRCRGAVPSAAPCRVVSASQSSHSQNSSKSCEWINTRALPDADAFADSASPAGVWRRVDKACVWAGERCRLQEPGWGWYHCSCAI